MSASHKPVLFFGVNSEGLGHATRSLPLLQGLADHYDLHVFCGGRAYDFLKPHVPHIHAVWHLQLIYEDNRLLLHKTIWEALKTAHRMTVSGFSLAGRCIQQEPVAVISDYEPMTAWGALLTGTPIVCIDNQHVITYGDYPAPPDKAGKAAKQVMRNSNFWNHPLKHRTLISSFFKPPLLPGAEEKGVRYVPTTARPQVLARMGRTRTDGPVLVYQTSSSNKDLLGTLGRAYEATGLSFVVYGHGAPEGRQTPTGVQLRAFSEETFFDELAAAPFVVVNGGHSTINEALALGKPVLAEPIRDQYEQATNVVGLEMLGVGCGTEKLSVEDLIAFQAALPERTRAAANASCVDNEGVLRAVMQAIQEVNPSFAVDPNRALLPMRCPVVESASSGHALAA
ncbi:MAG TPA: glycosyltransferase family protein [Myxococcaceae bacterium]|nr:glycosyltransferase family protein [Myxococcaceae bacterium]